MSNLPVPWEQEQPSRQVVRAARAQQKTELAIHKHSLKARYEAECERVDAQALSDVVRTALEEEIGNLDWGMELAAGSAAKAELVSRKLTMQAKINSDRIARRFGS
jgi:hypothetical protein